MLKEANNHHQARLSIMKNKYLILSAILTFSLIATAQKTVRGVIISSSDSTKMIGVTILEKGTRNGTISNIDGEFSIRVTSEKSVLTLSAIGYKTTEILVGNRSRFHVVMEDESYNLDETVVIGYGTAKKSDLIGAVGSLSAKDIENYQTTNIDNMMGGRIAGVNVTSSSGEPGAGISIRIRGASSVNSDVEPLYVIDGIPISKSESVGTAYGGIGNSSVDPLAMINPSDIKSIEVFKDASATAIYGSRGANGVVVITTKGGQEGRPKINYSTSFGASFRPQKTIEVLDGVQFSDYMYLQGMYPLYQNEDGSKRSYADSTSYNWQDKLFRTAFIQNHSLNVGGGTLQTKYNVSFGSSSTQGIIRNSSFERLTGRINLDQEILSNLNLSTMFNFANTFQNGSVVSSDTGTGSGAGVIQQMLTFRPVNTGALDEIDSQTNSANPVMYVDNMVKTNEVLSLQYNVALMYKLLDMLNFRTSISGMENRVRTVEYLPSTIGPGYQMNGRNSRGNAIQSKWAFQNTFTYYKSFSDKSRINAVLGFTMENNSNRIESVSAQNIVDESLKEESISWASEVVLPLTNQMYENTLMSFLGRVQYSLRDKYLFTASLRSDGSSKFTGNNKFSYFPSAAFAWRINEEPFLKKVDKISNLKLRMSYGRTGNQSIPAYSSQNAMSAVYYLFNGGDKLSLGSTRIRIAADNLKWETTEQLNSGIDLGMFNSRLNITLDAYYKYTYDLLLNQPVTHIAGVDYIVSNIGSVSNKGIELSIQSVNIRNRKFMWETNFNISHNKNKVLDLGGVESFFANSSYDPNIFPNAFIVKKGESIGAMYGRVCEGVYQYDDFLDFYNTNDQGDMTLMSLEECAARYTAISKSKGSFTLTPGVASRAGVVASPGMAKFKDLDGNGIVNDEDRKVIGRSDPLLYGGITNNFTFSNFDISVFFQYSIGNNILNASYAALSMRYVNTNKTLDIWENSWKPLSPGNRYPYMTELEGNSLLPSTLVVEDGSYLRLKDFTIGYTLPKRILSRLKLSNLRLYVSAQNIWTLTSYSMYDPEIASNDPLAMGRDKFSFPRARTILGGLSIVL